mmetsp:Transcript_10774/g.49560  ORF Transcript_10774/g.49560 Transcript_10774/m.49560 type:complete len:269 (-) Transcript_10774:1245-2051(-)
MCSDTLSKNSPATMLTSSIMRTSYDLITDVLSWLAIPRLLTHLGKPNPATLWMVDPSIASAARPVGAAMPTTFPSNSSLLLISRSSTDLPVPPTPVTKMFFPSSTRSSARCCSALRLGALSSASVILSRLSITSATSLAPAPRIGEAMDGIPCAGLPFMPFMAKTTLKTMIAVADYSNGVEGYSYNYYEDLTPADAVAVVKALKAGQKPRVGSQHRDKAEPMGAGAQLTLTGEPRGPYCRDLAKVKADMEAAAAAAAAEAAKAEAAKK